MTTKINLNYNQTSAIAVYLKAIGQDSDYVTGI